MGLFDGLTGSVPVPTSRYEAVDVINLKNLNQSFDTPKGKFTLFKDFSLDIKDFSAFHIDPLTLTPKTFL